MFPSHSSRPWTSALLALIAIVSLTTRLSAAEPNPCPRNDRCTIWTYYIAAEPVEWDYAPTGKNAFSGEDLDKVEESAVFAAQDRGRIGRKYQKVVYRQYMDESFKKIRERPADEEHLGLLGPVLRAEVNQVIRIVFKNKAKSDYSMHPHGVWYDKDNEGADMGPDAGTGSKVAPGDSFTYTWPVPARAGPAERDGDAVIWAYHSHVSEGDIYDGLYGALVVYAPGVLGDNGLPKLNSRAYPVVREFFLAFMVGDENASSLLRDNVLKYAQNTTWTLAEEKALPPLIQANTTALATMETSDGFKESNMMHNVNGYFYGNLPGVNMEVGEHVRFYVLAFGNEVDIHSIHWHGITIVSEGHRRDVIEALPATFRVADAYVDNPGAWLLHCHVSDHMKAGMMLIMNITDSKERKTMNDMMAADAPRGMSAGGIGAAAAAVLAGVAALAL
ncbi:Cupredoxin [Catenaria anguillulae PL171]|uniref:Cupredoxin n=1 Tax=Catenaria anguillulae PL171 TaxID=765915 RepID=A0A1Y2HP01_9FUNG|nr:Cupredoxin [Catenaria anguillulae PL171]